MSNHSFSLLNKSIYDDKSESFNDLCKAFSTLREDGTNLDPNDVESLQRYREKQQIVSLKTWRLKTELTAEFSIAKAVLNEVR